MRDSDKTMQQLAAPSFSQLALLIGLSLAVHAGGLLILELLPKRRPELTSLPPAKVQVQVVEKPKPLPEPALETPKRPTPPPPPKKVAAPRAPRPTTSATPEKTSPPVLGLNPQSLSSDGSGSFAVPLGNTTDAKDEGKRLTPEEVKGLARDLSEDASLITSTFEKPVYTAEAEDAALEGLFVVEVFVNKEGRVTDAELRNKIGYGMDEKVLASALKARFKPRRDPLGQPIEGWTEISVRLQLE